LYDPQAQWWQGQNEKENEDGIPKPPQSQRTVPRGAWTPAPAEEDLYGPQEQWWQTHQETYNLDCHPQPPQYAPRSLHAPPPQ
jgi:hypothetical protein